MAGTAALCFAPIHPILSPGAGVLFKLAGIPLLCYWLMTCARIHVDERLLQHQVPEEAESP